MSREELFNLYFGDSRDFDNEVFEFEYSHRETVITISRRSRNKVRKLVKEIDKVKKEIAYRGDRLECHRRELRKNTYEKKRLCTKIISSLYRPTEILGGLM